MRVIEYFVKSKHPERVSEDMLVMTPYFAAVIDGASDPSGHQWSRGLSGGRLAAEALCQAIEGFPENADVLTAVSMMTNQLASRLEKETLSESFLRPSASVVIFSSNRREVWRVGDCHCRAGEDVYPGVKRIDEINTAARAAEIKRLLSSGHDEEELRQIQCVGWEAMPLRRQEIELANQDSDYELAFGVINGLEVPSRFIEVIKVEDRVKEIVLTSDGYPQPLESLALSEELIRKEIADDPLRIGRYPGFFPVAPGAEAWDDRAYLRIVF